MSRSRRALLRPVPLTAAAILAAATATAGVTVAVSSGGTALTVHDAADSAGLLTASYQAGTSWGTGYSGQYTITNAGGAAVTGWTLGFTLPAGTSLTSLWDGSYTGKSGTVTVVNESWDATIAAGATVTVGFEAAVSGSSSGQPTGCTINGAACASGATVASASPTASATTAAPTTALATTGAPTPTTSASTAPSASATPTATTSSPAASSSAGAPSAGVAGFAPYVDTSLFPPFSLVSTAQATGVKQFNLAFVVADGSGGCTPEWGGVTANGRVRRLLRAGPRPGSAPPAPRWRGPCTAIAPGATFRAR